MNWYKMAFPVIERPHDTSYLDVGHDDFHQLLDRPEEKFEPEEQQKMWVIWTDFTMDIQDSVDKRKGGWYAFTHDEFFGEEKMETSLAWGRFGDGLVSLRFNSLFYSNYPTRIAQTKVRDKIEAMLDKAFTTAKFGEPNIWVF